MSRLRALFAFGHTHTHRRYVLPNFSSSVLQIRPVSRQRAFSCLQTAKMATVTSDAPHDEIFLPNSEVSDRHVKFGATLKDIDGKNVLQDVNEHGLAYSAGFRTEDILLTVNDISTEGKDLHFLLDYLRRDRWANLLLAVKREREEETPIFKWIIFNVIVQDGTPRVNVHRSHENDTFNMPEFPPLTSSMDFLLCSDTKYDIVIEEDGNEPYLKILKDKVKFGSYDKKLGTFYKYTYSGGDPSKGSVVAFSLVKMDPPPDSNKATKDKTCFGVRPTPNKNLNLKAKKFPTYMVGQNIAPDRRFWYQKLDVNRANFTLESYLVKDWFLGKNNQNRAVLSNTKTWLKIGAGKPPCGEDRAHTKYEA